MGMRASFNWAALIALLVSAAACAQLGDRSTTAALEPPGVRPSETEPAPGPRAGPPLLPDEEVGPNFGDRPDNGSTGPGP
jgi:hypothetical protein